MSLGGTDEPVAGADVEVEVEVEVDVGAPRVTDVLVTAAVVVLVLVLVLVLVAVGSTPSALPGSGPVAAKLTALADAGGPIMPSQPWGTTTSRQPRSVPLPNPTGGASTHTDAGPGWAGTT